jgi:hypothetical protein
MNRSRQTLFEFVVKHLPDLRGPERPGSPGQLSRYLDAPLGFRLTESEPFKARVRVAQCFHGRAELSAQARHLLQRLYCVQAAGF